MKILYLGASKGTSLHRLQAMRRLGHQVSVVNPNDAVPHPYVLAKFHHETGGLFLEKKATAFVRAAFPTPDVDLIWVDNGRYVGPSLIRWYQSLGIPVVNYNVDDPYGTRDRFSWELYRRSVPVYDAVVVVRPENVPEATARGAKQVLHVFRSADEVAHAPSQEPLPVQYDVLFIGTWMPERGPFMMALIEQNVPLALVGDRWNRAPEWPLLKPYWVGPGTRKDSEYSEKIQSAKICLGLLSHGNRDRHTQRSLEIPSLGSVFCAERTDEHESLYRDGEEAVFWADAPECARICKDLLRDESRRARLARNGRERALANGHFNEKVIAHVIREVMGSRLKQKVPS